MKKALHILIRKSQLLLCLLGIVGLLFLTAGGLQASTDEQDEDDVAYVSEYSSQNAGADSYFKSVDVHPRRHHIIHSRRPSVQNFFNRSSSESGIRRNEYAFTGKTYTYLDSYYGLPRPYYYISLYRCALF